MLSVARLRPSSAARGYYERAADQDADWAAWTGIPVSEWTGRARVALAREGPVAPGELTRLLLGADPATGVVLRPPAPVRPRTRMRRGPAGLRHRGSRRLRPARWRASTSSSAPRSRSA